MTVEGLLSLMLVFVVAELVMIPVFFLIRREVEEARNPRLLSLDDATEGLAPAIRAEIWAAIRALKADGLAILAVDKSLKDLTAVADHCTILARGSTVWDGPPRGLNADLTARYLGI